MDFGRGVWYNDSMENVGQCKVSYTRRTALTVWIGVLAIATAMAAIGFICPHWAAVAETYGVEVVSTAWTYDGTAHQIIQVADGYEGEYSVTYLAADGETQIEVQDVVAAGTYYVQINAEADGDYAEWHSEPIEITVGKRTLNVSIQAASSTYGDAQATLSATHEGLVEGDEAPYSLYCAVDETTDAGTYDIECVETNSDNYDVIATGGEGAYTVGKRAVTVQADDKTVTYGDTPQALTASVTAGSIIDGDEVYTIACTAGDEAPNAKTNAGAYEITISATENANYELTAVNGTYTVGKRAVTVQADDKTVTYGDDALPLTASVTAGSIIAGDEVYTIACTAGGEAPNARTHAGAYEITIAATENGNYQLTAVNGAYTVGKRANTVVIAPVQSVYGEKSVALISSPEIPFLDGDENVYQLTADVDEYSAAGTYDVVGTTLNNDYDLTYTGGENAYTVTKRTLSVTWGNTRFVYDGTPKLPSITVANLAHEDVVKVTVEGEAVDAGVYSAVATGVDNANYALPADAYVAYDVQKAEATFDLTGAQTVLPYTGKPQHLAGVVTSGETTYIDNEFCEIGTYDVVVESGETANYRAGSMVVTVTVREAAPIVDTATGAANYYKQIDPQAAEKQGVNVTGIFNDAFADLTAESVTLTAYIGQASITFDRTAIEAVAGYEVLLTYKQTDVIDQRLPQDALLMIDVSLDGAALGNGTATVRLPLDYTEKKNQVLKVYYVSDEGEMVDMNATYADGTLSFETNHFSRYVVLSEAKLSKSAVTGIVLGSIAGGLALLISVMVVIRKKMVKASKASLTE